MIETVFKADLVNIKRIQSRSVVQYVFELDKLALSSEARHKLDDMLTGDVRLRVMVMPLEDSEAVSEAYDKKAHPHISKGISWQAMGKPQFIKWLNYKTGVDIQTDAKEAEVRQLFKDFYGIESTKELGEEYIQQIHKEVSQHGE